MKCAERGCDREVIAAGSQLCPECRAELRRKMATFTDAIGVLRRGEGLDGPAIQLAPVELEPVIPVPVLPDPILTRHAELIASLKVSDPHRRKRYFGGWKPEDGPDYCLVLDFTPAARAR